MDASDVRRGRPATHRAFEALHRERHWSASAEQYGAAAAILLGDLLLSWSDELLRTSGLPAPRVLEALGYFDLTRSEVVTGQFLDVSAQARGTSDVDAAMNVVRYKSAKYSIERPLHIGAALAGAAPGTIAELSRFGLPLGEAFQLRDDLLGVFGDPGATGKPAGDDLSEGKRTVLIALALDALGPAEREHLDTSLGKPLTTGGGRRAACADRRQRRARPGRGGHRLADRACPDRARRGRHPRPGPRRAPRPGRRRDPADGLRWRCHLPWHGASCSTRTPRATSSAGSATTGTP